MCRAVSLFLRKISLYPSIFLSISTLSLSLTHSLSLSLSLTHTHTLSLLLSYSPSPSLLCLNQLPAHPVRRRRSRGGGSRRGQSTSGQLIQGNRRSEGRAYCKGVLYILMCVCVFMCVCVCVFVCVCVCVWQQTTYKMLCQTSVNKEANMF